MKDYTTLRIVFMGTPDFAVASLDALVKEGCTIAGVITAPDKPAGRGLKPAESPVKKYAVEHGLTCLQPEKLKDPFFLDELRSLRADLQVVVAFRMLPEAVWSMPPMGTINLHASLLPQYRGAAPIQWAIINGEEETGLTTFRLKHEIDTGDILLQEKIRISKNETAGELYERMKRAGAALLLKTIKQLAEGKITPMPQALLTENVVLKTAPKITNEMCRINFNKTAKEVHNLVRGLSPVPGAFTLLNGKIIKIYKTELKQDQENLSPLKKPGAFLTDGKTYLAFACADSYLFVKEIQAEGRKKMSVEDFLRGFRFRENDLAK
ncbi:MAG: methionyl-tRNA formyltransferase [Chitinophagaceae bacterium]|nr:methionyl-tRNA formyltransferase [Chitinophagaceae bacterium]